eukprot:TRINITY_DN12283_c0_g1_i8.p1 TRINITY_DN12283_c0_g1~~TRINITY_DN12283_c0_g1_i8.p1  ORF type:complete len:143 (+),score=22.22 TRINITY_DN12283_c0_g1_i8:209-637(+)
MLVSKLLQMQAQISKDEQRRACTCRCQHWSCMSKRNSNSKSLIRSKPAAHDDDDDAMTIPLDQPESDGLEQLEDNKNGARIWPACWPQRQLVLKLASVVVIKKVQDALAREGCGRAETSAADGQYGVIVNRSSVYDSQFKLW